MSTEPTQTRRPLRRGIYVPTVAFFDETTEALDTPTTVKHVLRLASGGVAGLAVQGSNGEAVHLTHEERNIITKTTRVTLDSSGFGHLPLIVGCGAQSTLEVITLCKEAHAAGGDYALVLPPSYYQGLFSSETVVHFFRQVADASPLPIIIYNYPGATPGVDINSDQLITLSQHGNIVGCKFTCGNTGKLGRVTAAVKASEQGPTQFHCFAGSVDFTVPSHACGATGVIGGFANICPRMCVNLFQQCDRLEANQAAEDDVSAHQRARTSEECKALQAIVAEGDWAAIKTGVVGVKAALMDFFGYGGYARSPLPRPDEKMKQLLKEGMEEVVTLEKRLS